MLRLRLTSREQANGSEEGNVNLEAVQGVHAGVVEGGDEDVLLAQAAQPGQKWDCQALS